MVGRVLSTDARLPQVLSNRLSRSRLPLPFVLALIGLMLGFLPGGVTSASGQAGVDPNTLAPAEPDPAGDAAPAPTAPAPQAVEARDTPSDRGESITVSWTPPPEGCR